MMTLGDALPRECTRVRALLVEYVQLGPVGAFGTAVLEHALRQAAAALGAGVWGCHGMALHWHTYKCWSCGKKFHL